jgi:hypothetical protein
MPTRAVTASSSFSTSTSSRFLFCCEACFLTLVGRVRPVIPGATISALYCVFVMESNFVASQEILVETMARAPLAAGVSVHRRAL